MRVAQVSFSSIGGAGIVAQRLNNALMELDVDSSLIVSTSLNLHAEPLRDIAATATSVIDNGILTRSPYMFSILRSRLRSMRPKEISGFDAIHLHWIEGVLRVEDLKFLTDMGKKLIWTLHDMRPFTGGCHYSGKCQQFQFGCKSCPSATSLGKGLIRGNFDGLLRTGLHKEIHFVAPSNWILEKFKSSQLGRTSKISKIFNPGFPHGSIGLDKGASRLSPKVIVAAAASWSDPRKGLKDLLNGWQLAAPKHLELIVVGQLDARTPLPMGVKATGQLSEMELLGLFRQAAALVIPSTEENASLLISEARTQGLPIVVRAGTGSEGFVNDGVDGRTFEGVKGLANVFRSMDSEGLHTMYQGSRGLARQFEPASVASEYLKLYGEM